jgi:FkbM family methyltransferase
MATSLNSILQTTCRIKVVDIGANPIDSHPPYASLLQNGDAQVVGFEPNPAALTELNLKKGPNELYLSHAVGDGETHTIHFCAASGMTSLFRPNAKVLDLMTGFSEWARVVGTEKIATRRLDDVPEAAGFDLLKIDVQGAELMVMQKAVEGLRHAVCVQTEVEFVPLYIDQPLFSDVDLFLREQGFVLHRFEPLVSRVLKPLVLPGDPFAGLSQIFWTDAIYIRDFTRLDLLTSDQLLKLALILNDCYLSLDMVAHLLAEYDRRMKTQFSHTYMVKGLQLAPAQPQVCS